MSSAQLISKSEIIAIAIVIASHRRKAQRVASRRIMQTHQGTEEEMNLTLYFVEEAKEKELLSFGPSPYSTAFICYSVECSIRPILHLHPNMDLFSFSSLLLSLSFSPTLPSLRERAVSAAAEL